LPPALAGGLKVKYGMGFSPNLNFTNGAKAQKPEFTAYPPAKAGGNSCRSTQGLARFLKNHLRVSTD
jgi:hypothetical protein